MTVIKRETGGVAAVPTTKSRAVLSFLTAPKNLTDEQRAGLVAWLEEITAKVRENRLHPDQRMLVFGDDVSTVVPR